MKLRNEEEWMNNEGLENEEEARNWNVPARLRGGGMCLTLAMRFWTQWTWSNGSARFWFLIFFYFLGIYLSV